MILKREARNEKHSETVTNTEFVFSRLSKVFTMELQSVWLKLLTAQFIIKKKIWRITANECSTVYWKTSIYRHFII